MSMRSSWGAVALAASLSAPAQEPAASSWKIDLPQNAPIAVASADWGESRTSARGGAVIIELRSALSLRNTSAGRIRGVVLQVTAQEVTPGGKASVSVPSLDVGPGETFPVRVDLRLLRPLITAGGPLVRVGLDGVLFDDLTFFGPDRLHSRRTMTMWEMEGRRDRRHFRAVLEAGGEEALRRELLESLARQEARPRVDVRVSRGRSTNYEPEGRTIRFSFLRLPDAPVEAADGAALVAASEIHAPGLEVRNRSKREVRYFEVGWIVRDARGREFLAGAAPADLAAAPLAPGGKTSVAQDGALRFGEPVTVEQLTGVVERVEFGDGDVWVLSREALAQAPLARVLAPSPEEQRLTGLYRRKGLQSVIEALRK